MTLVLLMYRKSRLADIAIKCLQIYKRGLGDRYSHTCVIIISVMAADRPTSAHCRILHFTFYNFTFRRAMAVRIQNKGLY
jgi:hypothetical protein